MDQTPGPADPADGGAVLGIDGLESAVLVGRGGYGSVYLANESLRRGVVSMADVRARFGGETG